jgi:hypothetical protein
MLYFEDIPKSLLSKINRVLNEAEEVFTTQTTLKQEPWIKADKERFDREAGALLGKEMLHPKTWNMSSEEKDEEETEVDEGKHEKIIMNPEVHPDRINEPDKVQKTV